MAATLVIAMYLVVLLEVGPEEEPFADEKPLVCACRIGRGPMGTRPRRVRITRNGNIVVLE